MTWRGCSALGLAAALLAGCTPGTPANANPQPGPAPPSTDGGMAVSCTAEALVMEPLRPRPGELFYVQLGLGGPSLGEAALGVGPDGTIFLIDVGNNAHDDDVRDALDDILAAMPAEGFSQRPARTVDVIILTHHHADHEDGLEDLLQDVAVGGRIIHRGLLDVTEAANPATMETLCNVLAAHPRLDAPLCEGPAQMPCSQAVRQGSYPSDACTGLSRGNLLMDWDNGPSFVPLGEGARLTLLAAGATVGADRYEAMVGPLLQEDSNGENARSVVGLLSHGAFRMLFAGDLTGGGSQTDPVEAFIAARLPSDLTALGVDVLHVSHHGRDTSSSAAWLDALLPRDGRPRHALMGISTAHLGSPHASVLDALLDGRLGGGAVLSTRVAAGGARREGLLDAEGGQVRVRTEEGGAAVLLQAVRADGSVVATLRAPTVRACASN